MSQARLVAEPISEAAYAPFGDLLSLDARSGGRTANQGSARRLDFAATLENLRAGAKANLSLFRCEPRPFPFNVALLERHRHSTQVFLPVAGARFVAVVAGGGDAPDLGSVRAFLVEGAAGISYRAGVWHHPMIALDRVTDFACFVFEDGTADDCEEYPLTAPFFLELSV